MAFPTKMYFSLSEVSARWHRQTKDVEYCIENGLLNAHIKVCSVKLTSNMLLNKFPHNSQEIYEYTGCKRITPEDCHILFRHYKRQVSTWVRGCRKPHFARCLDIHRHIVGYLQCLMLWV